LLIKFDWVIFFLPFIILRKDQTGYSRCALNVVALNVVLRP